MRKKGIYFVWLIAFMSCVLWLGGIEAEAAGSGTCGALNWSIDASGHLTISGNGDFDAEDIASWFGNTEVTSATVTVSGITSTRAMFAGCSNLTSVDLSGMNTANVTDMTAMFGGCKSLKTITFGNFNTTNVVNMSSMFDGCESLENVSLNSFNTTKVSNMSSMFVNCKSLTSLDLSKFSIDANTYTDGIIDGCDNLNRIVAPKNCKGITLPEPEEGYVWCNNDREVVERIAGGLDVSVTYTKVLESSLSSGESSEGGTGDTTQPSGGETGGTTSGTTESSGGGQTGTTTPQPTLPKVGSKHTVSNGIYKVTKSSASSKEVTLTKLKNTKKTSFTIPATVQIEGQTYTVTEIAAKAFKNNKTLKSVTIGKNISKIGKEAFSGCKELNKITIKTAVLKSVGKNAIKGIKAKATIKVPKKQLAKYKKLFKSNTGYKATMKIKK